MAMGRCALLKRITIERMWVLKGGRRGFAAFGAVIRIMIILMNRMMDTVITMTMKISGGGW